MKESSFKNVFLCQDIPGDIVCMEKFRDGNLIVSTDRLYNRDVSSYSFGVFDKKDCGTPLVKYNA